jgi:hypothetical protein
VAELDEAGSGLIVLPADAARAAALPENWEVSATDEAVKAELIDRLAPLLGDGGRRHGWRSDEIRAKTDGVQALCIAALTPLNGVLKIGGVERAPVAYDTYTFRYTAHAEETREGLLRASVNASTRAPVPGLSNTLSGLEPTDGEPHPAWEAECDAAAVFEAALAEAKRIVNTRLDPLVSSLKRRLARDERRLTEYYGTLAAQATRRGARNAGAAEDKKAAIERELDRKLRELDHRYRVRVEFEPLTLSRAILPATVVRATLHRRKVKRDVVVVWNAALREVEAPACEACGCATASFYLCDARAHVVCRSCAESHNLKRSCPACR